MKTLKIGVCGVGNVGGAVLENLANSPNIVEDNGGVRIEIIQVGARKGKSVVPYDLDVVTDLMEVARNSKVDVLVELIGGCDLAKDLIEEAIKNGKHIVTANKALIATHGDELFELALKEAQDLGLAEADPTMDVDGTDAAQKASILSALAFNTPYDFNSVSYEGIENVSPEDILFAEQLEYSVKHIAYGSIVNGGVNVSAFPTFVPKGQLLSQVGQQMNALEIFCEEIGSTVYYGPGAGPKPTASAVIADLVDLSKGGWPVSEKKRNKNNFCKEDNQNFGRYFNLNVINQAGAIAKLSSVFADSQISIEALIQKETKTDNKENAYVPVVIISGPLTEIEAIQLKNNLESMEETSGFVKQFRIYNVI